jgi:small subunit ribosomal protein S21
VIRLARVKRKQNESLESALRRFKKQLEVEGTLRNLKELRHYEKPSQKKRRKVKERKRKTW